MTVRRITWVLVTGLLAASACGGVRRRLDLGHPTVDHDHDHDRGDAAGHLHDPGCAGAGHSCTRV